MTFTCPKIRYRALEPGGSELRAKLLSIPATDTETQVRAFTCLKFPLRAPRIASTTADGCEIRSHHFETMVETS